jgi:hypothetical protein
VWRWSSCNSRFKSPGRAWVRCHNQGHGPSPPLGCRSLWAAGHPIPVCSRCPKLSSLMNAGPRTIPRRRRATPPRRPRHLRRGPGRRHQDHPRQQWPETTERRASPVLITSRSTRVTAIGRLLALGASRAGFAARRLDQIWPPQRARPPLGQAPQQSQGLGHACRSAMRATVEDGLCWSCLILGYANATT